SSVGSAGEPTPSFGPSNRNLRFQLYLSAQSYASHPLASRSDRNGGAWAASGVVFPVPITLVGCFLFPTWLATETPSPWITWERSIRRLSWLSPVRQRERRYRSQHAAKTLLSEMPSAATVSGNGHVLTERGWRPVPI